MIKTLTAVVLATASLAAAPFALADKPGPGWITIEKAIEKAKSAGYTQIYKIEADDNGYWEGEGRKADSLTYEFRIDGTSGNILRDQKD
ncbi:PepSY domain-containing protein [Pseudomonas sp. GD03842]|uniref:PepSY domain-containing protein n=1 Tax=unclassified Pseudomonas TaxID=196821 RepID=UPI000D3DB17F|nr:MULTISPECIES: PepSY domain-containing protein [unclassified Pseudomonas]MDH0744807.1 PepSY domain-containing protein [Pseudomonas sp. GD03842]RAU45456.1 PepSY domain-containing protein [Pseudomonas sp. RIT 409]RAU53160.1 PepSY domain-containing protein [Pseudomonas sp. RIT 412]